MPTHVCLVGRQPMPNLLGALVLRPDHVVLLTTEQEDEVRKRLEGELKRHRIQSSSRRIDPYDPNNVRQACEAILDRPPSSPVALNATGGTKVAALTAVSAFQQTEGGEVFYVNTDRACIQWLVPVDRSPVPLEPHLSIKECLGVHGLRVVRGEQESNPQERRLLSARIARLAARTEPLLNYFRRVFFHVDKEKVTLSRSMTLASDDFPPDLGPAQRELLDALTQADMATMDGDTVAAIRSADLRYLGGGRWLEEYCYLTLRDLHLFDEIAPNLVLSWGESVENEIDVVAALRGRLFFFSCKTGGAIGSWRKDDLAQEEVFKLETLRDLAGGTFARAVLVAGSKMTPRLKQRCHRLGIEYVDVDNLHRLNEFARRVAGA